MLPAGQRGLNLRGRLARDSGPHPEPGPRQAKRWQAQQIGVPTLTRRPCVSDFFGEAICAASLCAFRLRRSAQQFIQL